jgi:hypothetical protein
MRTAVLGLLTFVAGFGVRPASSFPSAGQEPAKPALIMRIERTGGFSGVSQTASMYSDGSIVLQGGKTQQTDPAMAADFVQKIPTVAAPLLKRTALPHNRCADCFVYIFTIPTGGDEKMFLLEETLIANPPGNESQERKKVYAFLHKIFRVAKSE